jgi:hypothetical protein
MRWCLVLGSALVMAGCAGGGSSATSGSPRPVTRNSNLITQQEIAQGQYSTALDIVQSLRPEMMRTRASTLSNPSTRTGISAETASSINVVVFSDDTRLGEVGSLASIPAGTVQEIRYINARDATTRWGTGYGSGVIQVITKK